MNHLVSSALFLVVTSLVVYSIKLSQNSQAMFISWQLWDKGVVLEFPFIVDSYSMIFLATVCVISMAIYVFSGSYMFHERFYLRFHVILGSFVASMILLIVSPNIVSLLLGWDGLGLTSYLLVVYFQSTKSFNAGMITALTNRLGDVLLLLAISSLTVAFQWNYVLISSSLQSLPFWAMVCILVGACTKSAQIPFSAWLPAAMAAPTPVSSLVHSSTLVTAGIYLLFRFSPPLQEFSYFSLLLVTGMATMFMAGSAAMFEQDMKKVVALSTLSQLGVMMVTLGAGFSYVAYFHMVAHAFFKALLFITIGNMIHMSNDYQDIRKTGMMNHHAPLTLAFSLSANLSLCGLPFLSGFYSKDSCIELASSSGYYAGLLVFFYLATALTAAYTFRLIILTITQSQSCSLLMSTERDSNMNFSMFVLFPLATMGGSWMSWMVFSCPPSPLLFTEIKNLTLTVIFVGILLSINKLSWSSGKQLKNNFQLYTSMWGLPMISSRVLSQAGLSLGAWGRALHDLSWIPRTTSLGLSWEPGMGGVQSFWSELLIMNSGLMISGGMVGLYVIFM